MLVNTNGNPPSLTIGSVVINNVLYNGPYTVNYSTPLAAGKEYTLNVNFTKVPPTLSVDPISLFFTYNNTTIPQTVQVTTNQASWSVSGNPGWLTITPTSGSGTSFTVCPNSTTLVMRTATLTVSAGSATPVTVNVVQYGDIGGGAAIIYYDPTTRTLRVGRWGYEITDIKQITLFRFGSVIGVDNFTTFQSSLQNPTPFPSAVIKFNPSHLSTFLSTPGFNPNIGAPNYYTTPTAWNGTIASSPKVSDDAYHTLANVKAGRGDPCRLIGMTPEQIQGYTTDAQLYAAEQGWRTPTIVENVKYVKGPGPWSTFDTPQGHIGDLNCYDYGQSTGYAKPTDSDYAANFYVITPGNNTNPVANPNTFWTPVIQGPNPNTAGERHPTPGCRHNSDPWSVSWVGQQGHFWSGTPYGIYNSAECAYSAWISFRGATGDPISIMRPGYALGSTFYLSVRCVRMW